MTIPAPLPRPEVSPEELADRFPDPPQRDPQSRLVVIFPPPLPEPRLEEFAAEERYADVAQRDPNASLVLRFPPPLPAPRPESLRKRAAGVLERQKRRVALIEEKQKRQKEEEEQAKLRLEAERKSLPVPVGDDDTEKEEDVRKQKTEEEEGDEEQKDEENRVAVLFPPPEPDPRPLVNAFPPPPPERRPAADDADEERYDEPAARDPNSRVTNLFPPPLPDFRPKTPEELEKELPPPPPPPDEATINACLAAVNEAGVKFTRETVDSDNAWCRPGIPMRVSAFEGEHRLKFTPPVLVDCRLALAMVGWWKDTVVPAATEHLAEPPTALSGASYVCRRRFGRTEGPMSEHATAKAIDVMGFTLSQGKLAMIDRDYEQETPLGLFLQKIRQDACKHFSTVLGPGSDAAHGNHFHLDVIERKSKYRVCN